MALVAERCRDQVRWWALMGSANRGSLCKALLSGRTCAGFRVVFAVGTRPLHDGSSRGSDLPRWTTHSAEPSSAHHQAGSSGPCPGRDVSWAFASERLASGLALGCPASRSLEELARPQHGVHHDRELSGDCDGGPLEADPLLELEPPCPERALGRGSR